MERGASPPSRGAWIEIPPSISTRTVLSSPPSRGAWIENIDTHLTNVDKTVAPLAGGVD